MNLICNKICLLAAMLFILGKLSSGQQTIKDYSFSLIAQLSHTDPNYCALVCTVDSPSVYKFEWTYNSEIPAYYPDAQITTGFDISSNDTHTCTTLTQDPYYAGYYYCHISVTEDPSTELEQYVKINENNPGSPIHSECDNETDCLALNSTCNTYCECAGDNYINPLNTMYTTECVSPRNEGESCTYDVQCEKPYEDYDCNAGECMCHGTKTPIAEMSYQEMCIAAVPISGSCNFNEQCTLATPNTACLNVRGNGTVGQCECQVGRVVTQGINNYDWYCDDTLTGGQIAGIVIGSLAGVGIISSTIYFIWFKVL